MTYNTIADMVESRSLTRRLNASAAQEHKANPPEPWVAEHVWLLVSSPGWSAAWESAVASEIEDPGAQEGVITDGMILGAVQPMT